MEHLKSKHEIKCNTLAKEIDSLNEQLNSQKKRTFELEKLMEKEKISHQENLKRIQKSNDELKGELIEKDNNLEKMYNDFQQIKNNLEKR